MRLSDYVRPGDLLFLVHDSYWGTVLGLVYKVQSNIHKENYDCIGVLWTSPSGPELVSNLRLTFGPKGSLRKPCDVSESELEQWRENEPSER